MDALIKRTQRTNAWLVEALQRECQGVEECVSLTMDETESSVGVILVCENSLLNGASGVRKSTKLMTIEFSPLTPHDPTAWNRIKFREGKKRQIGHMTAAVGLFTLRLVRVAIGPLKLGDLRSGEWRELHAPELNGLKK